MATLFQKCFLSLFGICTLQYYSLESHLLLKNLNDVELKIQKLKANIIITLCMTDKKMSIDLL